MKSGAFTILIRLFFLPIPICIASTGFSQKYEIKDTSYFVSWDDDFNLIMSADKGDTANVLMLLARGADINTTTIDGVTPLLYAAQNSDLRMVKILVDSGADINKVPYDGATALIVAAKQNDYDIAEFLAGKDADLNIRDESKVTAVHYAAAYNNYDIMDMLIYYGADIELPDAKGNTPLISATFNNCYEAVDLLIQNGANVNAADNNGNTALMVAVQQQNIDLVYLLLENGAEVNTANKAGMSALSFAVSLNDLEIARLLVQNGADINQKSGTQGIFDIAKKNRNSEMTFYLDSLGAKGSRNPDFDLPYLGIYTEFNKSDFMNGFEMGVSDSKYQLGICGGFAFRPIAKRVIDEISNVKWQFWERRYYFYLGLEKRFRVVQTYKGNETGPFIGAKELITWGGYRGSKLNPDVRLVTAPVAGWFLRISNVEIRADYHYQNFKTPEIGKHRFSVSVFINSGITNQKTRYKKIDWLD